MAVVVVMPKAGISVESCIIGRWLKGVGDRVEAGDILFDYETDKAAFECESTADGVLLEIFFADGEEVPVLTPVCAVGSPGEDTSALRPSEGAARPDSLSSTPVNGESPGGSAPMPPETQSADRISPRAKRLAGQLGVSPEDARPSGPHGRMIARDIQALAGRGRGEAAEDVGVSAVGNDIPVPDHEAGYTDAPFSMIRRTIAKSMGESLKNTAQLTHHHSFDASRILALRAEYKQSGEDLGLRGVSIGDMILFAVSRLLKTHPELNGHILGGDTLRRFAGVHLGVAVDTPRGLMVPTLFGADRMGLAQLSGEVKRLAEQARSGQISPDLLTGATFTVSNLGATGVEMFTPILNPPQVGILGVCGVVIRVREGTNGIETYPSIGLSLTYDHRAVDGAPASRFARALCEGLERFPLLLAL